MRVRGARLTEEGPGVGCFAWRPRWQVLTLGLCVGLSVAGSAVGDENPAAPGESPPGKSPSAESPVEPPGESPSAESDAEPRQLLERAVRLYESESYIEALEMFERVYTLEPNPAVLFNIGAVHAALGHCELARDAYRRYIDQTRSASGRDDALRQLERLNDCESPSAPAAATPSVVGHAGSPAPSREVAPEIAMGGPALGASNGVATEAANAAVAPGSPNGMHVAGWVALGSGGAMLLASLGCAYASWRADASEGSASPGQSGDDVARRQDDGQRYNALAWGLGGGSVALAATGLLLLVLEPESRTSIHAAPGRAGFSVALEQRF